MLFIFFASGDKVTNTVQSLTQDERVFASVQIGMLANDPEYAKKIEQSPRDTVLLLAPLLLTENHPQLFSNIKTKETKFIYRSFSLRMRRGFLAN